MGRITKKDVIKSQYKNSENRYKTQKLWYNYYTNLITIQKLIWLRESVIEGQTLEKEFEVH